MLNPTRRGFLAAGGVAIALSSLDGAARDLLRTIAGQAEGHGVPGPDELHPLRRST